MKFNIARSSDWRDAENKRPCENAEFVRKSENNSLYYDFNRENLYEIEINTLDDLLNFIKDLQNQKGFRGIILNKNNDDFTNWDYRDHTQEFYIEIYDDYRE